MNNSPTIDLINEWDENSHRGKSVLKKFFLGASVPKRLREHIRDLEIEEWNTLLESLFNGFFSRYGDDYLSSPRFRKDMVDQIKGRLEECRLYRVPWIDNAGRLEGARLLEIGCGTGSSTVAFAEQGALVTSVDVDEASLAVARDRCRLYGLDVQFLHGNAASLHKEVFGACHDIIVYHATLEHLTTGERIESLRQSWDILVPGGIMVITATPNRLWYYDSHTSLLPFYHWLPDDVALIYASRSGRDNFSHAFKEPARASMEDFLRWGRGMSYHELEIAIAPLKRLAIISSLSAYRKKHYPFATFLMRLTKEYGVKHRYTTLLGRLFPEIPEAFLQENIDIIIRK